MATTTTTTGTTKQRRIVGEERRRIMAELADRYTSGETIRALVEATGRSYGLVYRLLSEADVQFRRRGGNRWKRRTGVNS
jgi:hypothetical protein